MFCIVRKTTKSRLFNAIALSVVLSLLLQYMEDVPMADALQIKLRGGSEDFYFFRALMVCLGCLVVIVVAIILGATLSPKPEPVPEPGMNP